MPAGFFGIMLRRRPSTTCLDENNINHAILPTTGHHNRFRFRLTRLSNMLRHLLSQPILLRTTAVVVPVFTALVVFTAMRMLFMNDMSSPSYSQQTAENFSFNNFLSVIHSPPLAQADRSDGGGHRGSKNGVMMTTRGNSGGGTGRASRSRRNNKNKSRRRNKTDSVSDVQRIRHVLRRLSFYQGAGRGFARAVHVAVSLIGIFGMFAAIVGALLAPWMTEAGNSVVDDDQFVYWIRADDREDSDDEHPRACGTYREESFAILRLLDVA